jgi:hypothetical protein
MAVPGGPEEFVSEPQDENILDHLLSQIVIDSEDFLLLPVRFQGLLQLPGALKIFAKRFLDLYHRQIDLSA